MKTKGNFVKCERCSEKKGEDIYFFSSKYAKNHTKPMQCNICKRLDWEKVKK